MTTLGALDKNMSIGRSHGLCDIASNLFIINLFCFFFFKYLFLLWVCFFRYYF